MKHVLDLVNSARDEWETETATRANQSQTCSHNETQFLVQAIGTGKGIKIIPGRAPPPGPSPTLSQPQPTPSKIYYIYLICVFHNVEILKTIDIFFIRKIF